MINPEETDVDTRIQAVSSEEWNRVTMMMASEMGVTALLSLPEVQTIVLEELKNQVYSYFEEKFSGDEAETAVALTSVIENGTGEYVTKCGRFRLVIEQSEHDSPREWETATTMVCYHSRYALGDGVQKTDDLTPIQELAQAFHLNPQLFGGWDELRTTIENDYAGIVGIKPLYLYDHGGVSISTTPFSCPWDSGQIGFVIVQEADLEKEGIILEQATPSVVDEIIEGEIDVYDQYLRGDIYAFALYVDGECMDGCGGFFGDHKESGLIEYLENETTDFIGNIILHPRSWVKRGAE